jgi:hypothetical protein
LKVFFCEVVCGDGERRETERVDEKEGDEETEREEGGRDGDEREKVGRDGERREEEMYGKKGGKRGRSERGEIWGWWTKNCGTGRGCRQGDKEFKS